MPNTLVFLHTLPLHIAAFERLLAEAGADVPVRHLVAEELLAEARANGINAELAGRIRSVVDGAGQDAAVLLCTCSTIGGEVEHAAHAAGLPVVRVDRAMAERAVATGRRIVVIAALASTLEPTRELLLETARRSGVDVELREVLCEGAWQLFEQNEPAAFARAIADCAEQAAGDADVIVLAQASMAPAAELCSGLGVPVLSSPRLGLQAALQMLNAEC